MTAAKSGEITELDPASQRAVLRRLAEFEPPLESGEAPGSAETGLPSPLPGTPEDWAAGSGRPAPRSPTARHRSAEELAAAAATTAVLRRLVEVLDGRRPPEHLRPLLSPSAYSRTETVLRALRGGRAVPPHISTARLLSVHPCHPASGVIEVSAVWRLDGRVRAIAARFERRGGPQPQWRCTVLLLHA